MAISEAKTRSVDILQASSSRHPSWISLPSSIIRKCHWPRLLRSTIELEVWICECDIRDQAPYASELVLSKMRKSVCAWTCLNGASIGGSFANADPQPHTSLTGLSTSDRKPSSLTAPFAIRWMTSVGSSWSELGRSFEGILFPIKARMHTSMDPQNMPNSRVRAHGVSTYLTANLNDLHDRLQSI